MTIFAKTGRPEIDRHIEAANAEFAKLSTGEQTKVQAKIANIFGGIKPIRSWKNFLHGDKK